MPIIFLSQGQAVLVDEEDYEALCHYKWQPSRSKRTLYAMRQDRDHGATMMHRQILGLQKGDGLVSDHINGNGLDNRRSNLRIATWSQNGYHKLRGARSLTGYRGVIPQPRLQPTWRESYQARIKVDSRQLCLGTYNTARQAAEAYNDAAVKYHGEFAILNEFTD